MQNVFMIKFLFSISQNLVIGLLGTRNLFGITNRFTNERASKTTIWLSAGIRHQTKRKSLKWRRRNWAAYVTWWPQFVDVNSLAVYRGDTKLACYSRKLLSSLTRCCLMIQAHRGSVVGSVIPLLAYFCFSNFPMTSVVRCTTCRCCDLTQVLLLGSPPSDPMTSAPRGNCIKKLKSVSTRRKASRSGAAHESISRDTNIVY